MKHDLLKGLSLAALIVVGIFVYSRLWGQQHPTILSINDMRITVEIADTAPKQAQGLSDRLSMKKDRGMLFVFDTPQKSCFWMKDMHFNLDILWFDANRQLVYQQQDLSPQTYPKSFCTPLDAKYVLEVVGGASKEFRINQDQVFEFVKQ